jgi:hypothetical protein
MDGAQNIKNITFISLDHLFALHMYDLCHFVW